MDCFQVVQNDRGADAPMVQSYRRYRLPLGKVLRQAVAGVLVMGLSVAWAWFEARAEGPVSVELVGHIPPVQGNDPLYIGVRFQIQSGWHLYWKNPGESGLPTKVAWELPPGFSAGPLIWPLPILFSPSGQPKMYGYEGEVVLMSRLEPPASYKPGDPIAVIARASWLGCSPQSCVRHSEDLEQVMSAEKAMPLSFFDGWLRKVPGVASNHEAVESVGGGTGQGISITWREKVSAVEFISDQALTHTGWRTSVTNPLSPEGKLSTMVVAEHDDGAEPRTISGVLLFQRQDGRRDGFEITLAATNPGGTGK